MGKTVKLDKDVLYLIDEKRKQVGMDRSSFIALCCTSQINVYCTNRLFAQEVGL